MMEHRCIFSIPDMDQLPDCFRQAMPSAVFRPDENGVIHGWPSFHVSQADPDGGYQSYTYTVSFGLDEPEDLELHIGYIVSTPRIPYIRLCVNGHEGYVYPFPAPSRDKEIRPGHALHAAIYNRQDLRIFIPARLVHAGENSLSVTGIDDLPEIRVTNRDAVARLDRMADACGWHYGAFDLTAGAVEKPGVRLVPTVLYKRQDGQLTERIDVVLAPPARTEAVEGSVCFSWDGGELSVPYSFEARAFGEYCFSCWIPDGIGHVAYRMDGAVEQQGTFERARLWKVCSRPHAHTDIG